MPKPRKPADDIPTWKKYQHKKLHIQLGPDVKLALKKLCEIEGRSMGQVLTRLSKAYIRSKAKKLRAVNYAIPQEVFMR